MTWFQQSANETQAASEHYDMFLAADFDFTSGHVRVWTGFGVLTIDGNTYLGMGEFGAVSSAPERSNLVVERKIFRLSGAPVNPALVLETDIDASFGRSVTQYLGFLNKQTRQLLATPEIDFEGEISNIRRIDGSEPAIEVNAVHRLRMLDQVDGWRYTHEHQLRFYPASPIDIGFKEMPTNESKEVLWAGRRVIAGTGGSGGRRPGPTQPQRQ